MRKAQDMEEYMLESNADHDIILRRVQRQISSLTMSNHRPSTYVKPAEDIGIGRGIFQGNPPHVRPAYAKGRKYIPSPP
jgi:hypothetical protein